MDEEEINLTFQTAAFTFWCNQILNPKGITVVDLFSQLQDGLTFPMMTETLLHHEISGINKKPKFTLQKASNISLALNELAYAGVTICASSDNFILRERKGVLGTLWLMYEFFEISKKRGNSHKILIESLNKILAPYNMEIKSLKNFAKKNTLYALIDSLRPGCCPFLDTPKNDAKKLSEAIDFAEKEFGIRKLVDAEYLRKAKDRSVLLVYLMQFVRYAPEKDFTSPSAPSSARSPLAAPEGAKSAHRDAAAFTQASPLQEKILPSVGIGQSTAKMGGKKVVVNAVGEGLFGGNVDEELELGLVVSGADNILLQDARIELSANRIRWLGGVGGEPFVKEDAPVKSRFFTYSVQRGSPEECKIAYTFKVPGKFFIDVKVDGQSVQYSPFGVVILPLNTSLYGEGVVGGSLDSTPGEERAVEFVIDSGIEFEGFAGDIQVDLVSPSGKNIPAAITDRGDGTYSVKYTPPEVGAYSLSAKMWGFFIDERKTPRFSRKISEEQKVSKAEISLRLFFEDESGNPKIGGGEKLAAILHRDGKDPLRMSKADNKDGSFTFSLERAPDKYSDFDGRLEILLDGRPFSIAPLQLSISTKSEAAEKSEFRPMEQPRQPAELSKEPPADGSEAASENVKEQAKDDEKDGVEKDDENKNEAVPAANEFKRSLEEISHDVFDEWDSDQVANSAEVNVEDEDGRTGKKEDSDEMFNEDDYFSSNF